MISFTLIIWTLVSFVPFIASILLSFSNSVRCVIFSANILFIVSVLKVETLTLTLVNIAVIAVLGVVLVSAFTCVVCLLQALLSNIKDRMSKKIYQSKLDSLLSRYPSLDA